MLMHHTINLRNKRDIDYSTFKLLSDGRGKKMIEGFSWIEYNQFILLNPFLI